MITSSIYLKHEIGIKDLPETPRTSFRNKLYFVGIDMAPISTLETGIAMLDRNRQLLRMEKLDDDSGILRFLKNLAPPENMIVVLDVPKSLNIPSKWRQQQVKMHALTTLNSHEDEAQLQWSDRFADRAREFYDNANKMGILTLNLFSPHAKLRYRLNTPYRTRSSYGCRALQALMKQQLNIKDFPTNIAPSSVLDAMIAGYSAWLLCYGREHTHFRLYRDDEHRLFFDPLQCWQRPIRKRDRHPKSVE